MADALVNDGRAATVEASESWPPESRSTGIVPPEHDRVRTAIETLRGRAQRLAAAMAAS